MQSHKMDGLTAAPSSSSQKNQTSAQRCPGSSNDFVSAPQRQQKPQQPQHSLTQQSTRHGFAFFENPQKQYDEQNYKNCLPLLCGSENPDVPDVDQVYKLRSKELCRMSVEQRGRLTDEIHGVLSIADEKPEFVKQKLHEMGHVLESERRFSGIKRAYNMARTIDPAYVDDPRYHLMALRAEHFDVLAAAKRYILHYDFKLDLFGVEKLVKDIEYDDLDADDRSVIEAGFQQHLTKPDNAGRLVVVLAQDYQNFPTLRSVLRMDWYMTMKYVQDEEVQRRGIAIVVVRSIDRLSQSMSHLREQMFHGDRYMKSSMIRPSAVHYCYDSPALQPAVAIFQLMLGRSIRLRFCPHFGSPIEYRYKLQTYGIPVDVFPFDESGNLIREPFLRSVSAMVEEEGRRRKTPTAWPAITSMDVLHGRRGGNVASFPGNLALARIVAANLRAYEDMTREQRSDLFSKIVAHVRARGGRFLIRDKGSTTWRLATDKESRDKVSHAIRNHKVAVGKS